jgi:hypothetical protein
MVEPDVIEQGEGVGGGAAADPSLVLYRESVTGPGISGLSDLMPDGMDDVGKYVRCPRKLDYVMFNRELGAVAMARCKTNTCPYCAPIEAMLCGGAIALAKPTRAIHLTQVGDEWQTTRNRVKQFTSRMRREGYRLDWAYHVEPNPKGTGRHLHGYQRGDFLPQDLVSSVADSCGMGKVAWITKFEPPADGAQYGTKLVGIDYGLKMNEAEESARTFLAANGGRMVHATRGFWQDDDGNPCGLGEAKKAWAKSRGPQVGTWELVKVDQLPRALQLQVK